MEIPLAPSRTLDASICSVIARRVDHLHASIMTTAGTATAFLNDGDTYHAKLAQYDEYIVKR